MPIDLRSDTVTRPSAAMRRAMAEAEVGDDVLDGDPTTRRLEDRVAELLGKDDALFFPTGTQANQVAVWLDTRPGTELVVEANAHLVNHEMAAAAAFAGVQIRPVTTPDGLLTVALVRGALRPDSPHYPRVSAITVENTHAAGGGRVLRPEVGDAIGALAVERELALHVDGARLWNAAAALGVPPARLAAPGDTVMVSFSKGLGCPIGSVLALDGLPRADAWEARRRLGGAMRQSGILAAACLYALDHTLSRLADDHANARLLADALAGHPAVRPVPPDSNIVMLDLLRDGDTSDGVIPRLAARGLLVAPSGPQRLRAVTHLDVTRSDVERAVRVVAEVLT